MMLKGLFLTGACLLAPLSVAAAQVSVQTTAPVTGDAASAYAELQAAGEALEPIFEALETEAAVIRADGSLSAGDKEARILALIAPHQPAFDRLADAVGGFVANQIRNEGGTAEQAAAGAASVRSEMMQGIVQGLVTGEADEGGE